MSKKDSNWYKLQNQANEDSLEYRNVHEEQQLDRGNLGKNQKPGWRIALSVFLSILVGIIFYVVVSAISWMMFTFSDDEPKNISDLALIKAGADWKQPHWDPENQFGYAQCKDDGIGDIYCYQLNAEGGVDDYHTQYNSPQEVPVPQWWVQSQQQVSQYINDPTVVKVYGQIKDKGHLSWWMAPHLLNILLGLLAAVGMFAILYAFFMRQLVASNMMTDTTDVNQHRDDQHITLPEEMWKDFDWFPDAGAHSYVSPSCLISHMALSNKGVKPVTVPKRAKEDILDAEGDVETYAGEILEDEDGNVLKNKVPMLDEDFMHKLFTVSGIPEGKEGKAIRKFYNPAVIPYNPGNKNRDKLKDYDTLADVINNDWVIPEYETQRPAGGYIVDTAPVNTMMLAITRAGKGQTYIEPMISMWTRERNPQNIVINDPKGELLQKFYVAGTYRGFQIVQFNLINAMNTDIYNPLIMAATAAREGDFTKVAMYVENIAEVFFPVDGSEDPVWPNAANNAFKRAAYGLIDFYLEEEAEMRLQAEEEGWSHEVLETKVDQMWGKVTLYNCYQLFVQLSSKKRQNPITAFDKLKEDGAFKTMDPEEKEAKKNEIMKNAYLWESMPEADLLTLFFNATKNMPMNQMRTLVTNADNALRSMGAAEKMLASVYGIAITAMNFFADPTINTMTSGTPSQNVDLAGLSFPRRLGIRLATEFVDKYHLKGAQCEWQAYSDDKFQHSLGKDFYHHDLINNAGWARFYFQGIFPKDTAYLKCDLKNPTTGQLIWTFYYKFTKTYQTSLNGKFYIKDPILGEKLVHDGLMTQLLPKVDIFGNVEKDKDGHTIFVPGEAVYETREIQLSGGEVIAPETDVKIVIQTMQRYSEKPKMIFLVTPPHLMKYAKLLLILIKQLVDLNFDQSYMTKDNQKPLYKTRFMLDEVGNLQSEGNGIQGLETMLSIGLGQEQQFTLILQTLQQLRDVYGESVDRVISGNAQPLDAKIATPTGWKYMGDLQVGDEVLTRDGRIVKVKGVYPRGVRPVYHVARKSGASTMACNEHLWDVTVKKNH